MQRFALALALVLAPASIPLPAAAQTTTRSVLSQEGARAVLAAAVAEAAKLGTTGAIAVVDDGGYTLAFDRLDGTFPVASDIAVGKARTAAIFRKPTRDFEEIVKSGRTPMLALADRVGFTPLQGGVPITVGGQIVGAIGVSGAASAEQDEALALAGAKALASPAAAAPRPGAAAPSAWGAPQPGPAFQRVSTAAAEPLSNAVSASTGRILVNVNADGVALDGHDPIAFHTEKRPVKGRPELASMFGGAIYWFASAENKATFDADPARWEPAYGGYCGYAASIQRVSPINVQFFQIIDGRLILQHNQKAFDLWSVDVPGNVVKADQNWPGLVDRNGVGPVQLLNLTKEGVALSGYDAVAYFTESRAVKGDPAIESTYGGARYHFASQAHRAIFEQEPAKYVPAFGGYCGYAASINKVSPVDPTIFQILDGRLVLQHTKKAYELFNQDPAGNLAKADRNWPGLVAKHGTGASPGLVTRVKRLLGLPI